MGREVRMVPPGWTHPVEFTPRGIRFKPLHGCSFSEELAEWEDGAAAWERGEIRNYGPGERWKPKSESALECADFAEWHGAKPSSEDYMPDFAPGTATLYCMYEDTSEGTPISPAFETPEELARWLVDNNASAFGGEPASYEGWLRVAKGGFAPSMVLSSAGLQTGVDAIKESA